MSGIYLNKRGKSFSENSGFPLHGDILDELRRMELDSYPTLPTPCDRRTGAALNLKYSNGAEYGKDVPDDIGSEVIRLLRDELTRRIKADEKLRREFAAPEYAVFAAIRSDDQDRSEALYKTIRPS